MAAIYYGVGKVIYTKKYNKLQSELIEVEEKKYELEKEMFNIKKHKNDIKTTVTLDNGNTISFSNNDDLVVESIFAKYNGEKKKTKKLTLKK